MANAQLVNGGTHMTKAHLGKRSQLVLPKSVVDAMNLQEGAEFRVEVVDGCIVLEPMISIPRSQAWFWTEAWQQAEREAEEDIQNNRMGTIRNTEELEDYLKRLGAENDK